MLLRGLIIQSAVSVIRACDTGCLRCRDHCTVVESGVGRHVYHQWSERIALVFFCLGLVRLQTLLRQIVFVTLLKCTKIQTKTFKLYLKKAIPYFTAPKFTLVNSTLLMSRMVSTHVRWQYLWLSWKPSTSANRSNTLLRSVCRRKRWPRPRLT